MASPASRASSWSGIQSPVKTTTSHGTNRAGPVRAGPVRAGPVRAGPVHAGPVRASATSTPSSRPRPAIRRTAQEVHTGTRQRTAAPNLNAA